jgi:hypothetical protein
LVGLEGVASEASKPPSVIKRSTSLSAMTAAETDEAAEPDVVKVEHNLQ